MLHMQIPTIKNLKIRRGDKLLSCTIQDQDSDMIMIEFEGDFHNLHRSNIKNGEVHEKHLEPIIL